MNVTRSETITYTFIEAMKAIFAYSQTVLRAQHLGLQLHADRE